MKDSKFEIQGHLTRNKKMWEIWEEKGVNSKTELTVNFQFYAPKKKHMELFCGQLSNENIEFRVTPTRTFFFLKGWEIEADITKKWTLPELQKKTGDMFILSGLAGVALEGCGALMPGNK